MNDTVANGSWIVTQVLRVRKLEADVKSLLSLKKAPAALLKGRMDELNFELTLLELSLP
ncbi:MAG: hypothetical protein M3N41_02180 [Acidobacteriota bacterium]|nr:hypothetical protein [Acidobacteriota bacterium]